MSTTSIHLTENFLYFYFIFLFTMQDEYEDTATLDVISDMNERKLVRALSVLTEWHWVLISSLKVLCCNCWAFRVAICGKTVTRLRLYMACSDVKDSTLKTKCWDKWWKVHSMKALPKEVKTYFTKQRSCTKEFIDTLTIGNPKPATNFPGAFGIQASVWNWF